MRQGNYYEHPAFMKQRFLEKGYGEVAWNRTIQDVSSFDRTTLVSGGNRIRPEPQNIGLSF